MSQPVIPPANLVTRQQQHDDAERQAYKQFLRLVKARGLTTGAQIGVGFGGRCEALLDYRGIDSLVGVDPYQHRTLIDSPADLSQRDLDSMYQCALDRLARFGGRFELVREPALTAAQRVEDRSLDFVYLDADHRTDAVLSEWFDKVREGGIIAGHDSADTDRPDAQPSADGFFQRLNWPVHDAGEGVWWVQKQALPISYVIPAYNAEQTLWQAAVSVLDDNLGAGDELIIINDGSTDATDAVINTLIDAYPNVRIIRHANNLGAGPARNEAINHASHDLIFMLDADNVLPTDSVASLRKHLIATRADAVCFGEVRLFRDADDPSETAWTHQYQADHATFEQYCAMQDPPGAAGNLLFTREAWKRADGYPEHAGALDSWGFGLRIVATGSAMGVCRDAYYDHRIGHDSYWQREHQPGKTDRLALSLLRPFFKKLTTGAQFYLLQSENQDRWFSDLARRPLQVEGAPRGTRLPALKLNLQAIRQRLAKLVSRAA